tara:strand:- start:5999 stop:6592 length:594 start_codon:yes stop_codon:yes gene_type:complete
MIILLGFPKTGTTSFQALFNHLDLKSYHQVYKDGRPISLLMKRQIFLGEGLLDFIPRDERDITCLTQMDHCLSKDINFWPQITHYEELYNQNKDAIFLLNIRDIHSLLISFKKQMFYGKSLYDRFIHYNAHLLPTEGSNDEKMLHLFKNHYKNITDFFTKKKCKFIIYDIDTDKIDKLKEYIDIKDMTVFPHKHKSK